MKRLYSLALVTLLLLACSSLSACGKKGRPEGYSHGNYPTAYPNK